jgi:GNAT superfamily N-acetyltransferase
MMNLTFRPFDFSDADYAATVAIHNAALPDYPDQVEDWRHWDQHRPAHCKSERWVAELNGVMVAYGGFDQFPGMFHPQKFFVDVCVHPAHQLKGIGQSLYSQLIERLRPFDPTMLRCEVREDFAAANHIIHKHGFVEEMKFWESRLNVTTFDPSPWAGHVEQVLARGIEIVTLRQLMEQGDAFRRPLYEAMVEMSRDVPRPDEYTPVPFEEWLKFNLENPNVLPDGYFLAMRDGDFAGVSNLWKAPEQHVLHVGLTATRRNYRRMGIALALKLKAIEYARQQGVHELRTGNETRNRPMLNINEALGFVKQPVWVAYVKSL